MKQKIQMSQYPQMIQSFAKENFNLKMLSGACLGLLFLSLATVVFLLKQGPTVVALDNTGAVARIETKVTDKQIEAAAYEYLSHRYNWTDKDIAEQLKSAEFFVQGSLVPSFQKSMAETVKYVREKKVTQRLYPRTNATKIDLKERSITIVADRIVEFDSLRTATEMKLKLWFNTDDRTVINPWGVYVTKELENPGAAQ